MSFLQQMTREMLKQAELEMIKLATEMINKKQYSDAIELLADIRRNVMLYMHKII